MTCPRCGRAPALGSPVCPAPAPARPLAGLATAAMVALAGAALTDLLWAFTPLASVWAVREAADRGGQAPGTVLIFSYVATLALMGLAHLVAVALLAGWLFRAAANARVLGWGGWPAGLAAGAWFIPLANWLLPALIVVGVARASRCRRAGPLVWAWWSAWLAGVVALVAGTALTWPVELTSLLGEVVDGVTVDVDRAGELLGYQIAGRLPGGVLLVAAGALAIVLVHRVTWAQYDRFDEVAAAAAVSAPAPVALPRQVVLPRQVGVENAPDTVGNTSDTPADRAPAS